MINVEKLIEQYQQAADKWEKRHPVTDTFDLRVQDALRDAATALSTLQAENEKLRAEVESLKKEHCAGCSVPVVEAERLRDLNEAPKLRAELEQVKEDWSTAVNGLVLMQKKLDKVYCMLYDPLIIVDGGHLRPVKNTSRQQVYKKLVDLQVEMGINRGFPWGEMRMEKKED